MTALRSVELDLALLDRQAEKERLLSDYYYFFRQAWPWVENVNLVENWHVKLVCRYLQALQARDPFRDLIVNIPPGCSKSINTMVIWPAWVFAKNPAERMLCASYDGELVKKQSVDSKRLMNSDWYQSFFGDKVQIRHDVDTQTYFETTAGGSRFSTTPRGRATGRHPTLIACDDLANPKQSSSDVERAALIDWWDGTMETRGAAAEMNRARVVIAQRLHVKDIPGHIMDTDEGKDWARLILPMRYESGRMDDIGLGTDPRTEPGQLLDPARFPEATVAKTERKLGVYACTPYESPVLMADLTLKPIGEVKAGDSVIGFGRRERDDDVTARLTLKTATVLEVFQYHAPVVKMTLDSGKVIRCTRDHKWFTKSRNDSRHSVNGMHYTAAKVGSKLARICPDMLPELSIADERLAGWLSGFFDGEGTVSMCRKSTQEGRFRPSGSIHFYQGAGRNLPLCEKLEAALTRFGFDHSYREDHRKPNKDAPCYGYRTYTLANADPSRGPLPMLQRFMHIVQPTKWKDRIVGAAYGSKFIQGRERVVSIEPDGEEAVYALKTTTGNYVVWGLASSNSAGQLQQRPTPKESAKFKLDEIHIIPLEAVPFTKIVRWKRFWDKAATKKQGADYTAGALGGITGGEFPRMFVLDMVHGRFSTDEVEKQIALWARLDERRFGFSKMETVFEEEGGASGKQAAAETKRRLRKHRVRSIKPATSKEVRAEPLANAIAAGEVYFVEGPWIHGTIDEMRHFPKGEHDDRVDALSGLRAALVDGSLFEDPLDDDPEERLPCANPACDRLADAETDHCCDSCRVAEMNGDRLQNEGHCPECAYRHSQLYASGEWEPAQPINQSIRDRD